MKRFGPVLFIAVFFLLLALPALGLFTAKGPGEEESLGQWVEKNIGLRDVLITFHAQTCQALFGESGNGQVLLGKDGWLFFDDTMNDYYRRDLMSGEETSALAGELSALSQRLQAKGLGFIVLIAPNKNTIYPEQMPPYAFLGEKESNLAKVQESLLSNGVDVLDARSILLAGKGEGLLYYRTDTHWNPLGALLVYRELMPRLATGGAYDPYQALTWDESTAFTGDLSRLYLPLGAIPEMTSSPLLNRQYRVQGSMRSLSDMTLHTQGPANGLHVLIVRDSFGDALFPYLANNIGQMTFTRVLSIDPEALALGGVTHVVLEIAERNLPQLLDSLTIPPP